MKIPTDNLALIRRSKIEMAQWIATGIARCPDAAASFCLARYASEQLQTAALIPVSSGGRIPAVRQASLLQNELKKTRARNGQNSLRILAAVSQQILDILVTESRNKQRSGETTMRLAGLVARERRALALLGGMTVRRLAA